MKKIKNLLFYLLIIGIFSFIIYWIIQKGAAKDHISSSPALGQIQGSHWSQFLETFRHNIYNPLGILLLQIVTIIFIARIFGFIMARFGQPAVIGEILAGIFLGPSFLGLYFPEYSNFLFPAKSLGNLQFLSQIGLILFMFVVGMELDLKVLRNKAHVAVVVSHASIIFPFAMGMGLAYYIYNGFAPQNINFLSFSLFIGIAMSITAFPVLARIVQERDLTKTKLGSIAITCAATDDITAWCLLAAVIAIVKAGSFISSIYTILFAIGYVLIMLTLVRPFLKRVGDIYASKEGLSKPVVAIFFITLVLSAYATELIGIHALFGAFMAGVIMPPNLNFRNLFIEKVEDVSLVLLLPLFFVFTGLRTQIGLLDNVHQWQICGLIVLVAVSGKFLGSTLAARIVGQPWRDSIILGALMNTRGLMELVVLNFGYDLGVLKPDIFAMMVIMALVTTFMTGPILNLIEWIKPEKKPLPVQEEQERALKYKILISFNHPHRAKTMLKLASHFVKKSPESTSITVMHLTDLNELHQFNIDEYEQESFSPVISEAQSLNLPIITLFKATQDIDKEIAEVANVGNFDLLLVGVGASVYEGTILGRVLGFTTKIINPERLYDTITGKEKLFTTSMLGEHTRFIIKTAKIPVGIVVDKHLQKIENVIVSILTANDNFLMFYIQKLITNNSTKITLHDSEGFLKQNPDFANLISSDKALQKRITIKNNQLDKDILLSHDLLIMSFAGWRKVIDEENQWMQHTPSTLIIKA